MVLVLFNNLTNKDKSNAIEHLIKGSTPSQDFFFMIILSVITATFGMLLNNLAVIIGSMLIAPMLYPILSLSLGLVISDSKLSSRALYTILKSFLFGVASAAIVTALFSNYNFPLNQEILSRAHASLPFMAIAIVAGLAGSFALVKPQLNETLPGIAISVSLIPPIAVTGIGIAKLNWVLINGSFLLFLVNLLGIVFAGMITFSLMNFYVKRKEAHITAEKEDEKLIKQTNPQINKRLL
jgi:uncharacterized hydrophobic protein (TIGR00271 family)